jgi:hypothetical protein
MAEVPEFREKLLLSLWRHWHARKGAHSLPPIDVVELGRAIPALVPSLVLLEYRSDTEIHVRVAGATFSRFIGVELTGRNLLDYTLPEHRELRLSRTKTMLDHPCGGYSRGLQASHDFQIAYENEGLLLPVIRAGHSRPMLLSSIVIADRPSSRPATGGAFVGLSTEFRYLDVGFGVPA